MILICLSKCRNERFSISDELFYLNNLSPDAFLLAGLVPKQFICKFYSKTCICGN